METNDDELLSLALDDLDLLYSNSNPQDVVQAIKKYSRFLNSFVERLKANEVMKSGKAPMLLNKVNEIFKKAWAVPTHGHELGYTLCNTFRTIGGLEMLMSNCDASNELLQFASAQLLEQCFTTENRSHIVQHGLEKVVNVACVLTQSENSVEHSNVGTGILEHLLKHSEGTCSDVVRLGGLDAILSECRKNDVETLRHCAGALTNLSLYGGAENQEVMIKRKVPMWLFSLALHQEDNVKYYACLAIAVLVANKEIEAAIVSSGTLNLVESFIKSHNPCEFAISNLAHVDGQSKNWLQRLVPVLSSKREEARNLAAFHFCMEAGIKKQQGNTEIFRVIGAIEPLKKVASCPNAVASKYAAQALRLIGEEVPHKLSQEVPFWSSKDVMEWVKQIGFEELSDHFLQRGTNGDSLLQLTEEELQDKFGVINGIKRQKFMIELQNLQIMADYSSDDTGNLNIFLKGIRPHFAMYTYRMLKAGMNTELMKTLTEKELLTKFGIRNSIHRSEIFNSIKNSLKKKHIYDIAICYDRCSGAHLASILKIVFEKKGFTVFMDVFNLSAGRYDVGLTKSISQATHCLIVFTSKSFEICIADIEGKNWFHKEVTIALSADINLIPILLNTEMPKAEKLPKDMWEICSFNAVHWVHEYQNACIEKIERFMRNYIRAKSN